jgi:VWFA-related protein
MKGHCRVGVLASLLLLTTFFLPVPAADSPAPDHPIAPGIERERVNLILIDVIVTDRKGRLVSDLRPEDFSLWLDGHPYPIQSVELRLAGEAPEPKTPLPEKGRPAETVPTFTVQSPRRFVFLLDGLNCDRGLGTGPIQAVRGFLQNSLLPGDEVMIAGLGRELKVYQDFTSDRTRLLKSMEAVEADPSIRLAGANHARENMRQIQEAEEINGSHGPDIHQSSKLAEEAGKRLAVIFAEEDRHRILRTLASLRAVVASLNAGSGPKELFFLTDGFPGDPDALYGSPGDPRTKAYASEAPTTGGSVGIDRLIATVLSTLSVEADILQISREAGSAQVAIHTVNTQGLPHQTTMTITGVSGRSAEEIIESSASNALAGFALGTGGIASRGSNDFLPALQKVEAETRATYVISFAPPEDPDGLFHATRVEVQRKGVRARANEGFLYLTEDQKEARQLLAAYMGPELFHDFPVSLETITYLARGEKPALEFAIAVPDQTLLFLLQNGEYTARLEAGMALRIGKSQFADQFSRSVEVKLTPKEMGSGSALSLVARREVPPGDYEAVAVVRDLGTGNIGALRVPVKVPTLTREKIAMSSLVLESPGSEGRRVDLEPETVGDPDLVIPAAFRVFPRGVQIQASCFIYHPQRRPESGQAEFQVRGVLRKGSVVEKEFPSAAHIFTSDQEVAAIPLKIPISLAEIEPGTHTLQIEVLDQVGKQGVVQSVEFMVK